VDLTVLRLAVGLLAGAAITQIVLLLVARGLGFRLPRRVQATAVGLSLVLVVGYVAGDRILFPTTVISKNVPGAEPSNIGSEYAVLNDLVYQFMPWEFEVRRALANRRLPLWSDRIDGGSPLWANPQLEAASPLANLARLAPIEHHYLAAVALKLLVAFQGAWLLARLLGASRMMAWIAAASFAIGGGVMAWSCFANATTAASIPWLVTASIRTCRRPSARRIGATGLIAAVTLLSGHPETALGGGLLAATCTLTMSRRSRGAQGALHGIGAASLAAILGLAIAAPQLAPFGKLLPHTVRFQRMTQSGHGSSDDVGGWFDPAGANLLKGVASPNAFGSRPYLGGHYVPVAGAGYAGLVALAGAAAAFAMGIRRCLPFLLFAAGTAVMVAGVAPVASLVGGLPLLNAMSWSRCLPSLALCLACCGAVAFTVGGRRLRLTFGLGLAAAAAVSLTVSHDQTTVLLWVGLAAACAALAWRPRIGALLLMATLAADLGPWAFWVLPKGDPDLFYPKTPFIEALEREVRDRGDCRATGLGFTLYPSLLPAYGIRDVRYHNPVAEYSYAQLLDAAFDFHREDRPYEYHSGFVRPDRLLLDFLNVGFVVSGRAKMPRRFEPVEAASVGPLRIFRNRRILPRAFIAIDTLSVDGSETVETTVTNPDPRVVTLNRNEVGSWQPDPHRWSRDFVVTNSDRPGRVSLTVKGKGERLLATSFTHPFGWRATADGRRLKTVTINHAFVGVIVPADIHDVELRYIHPGSTAGFVLFAVGAIFIVGLLVWPMVRRNRGLGVPRSRGPEAPRSRGPEVSRS
jgi:hypothetical protein